MDGRKKPQKTPKLKPTQLRGLYDGLRHMSEGELLTLAKYHVDHPGRIASRFQKSCEKVAGYRYPEIDEPFHAAPTIPWAEDLPTEIEDTRQFAALLEDRSRYEVEGLDGFGFRYVDREIFPLRTVAVDGLRPDKRTVDLLLVGDTGRPIVGELKIRHDSLAYLALIQALMYAAELSSENQLRRLAAQYPDSDPPFRVEAEGKRLDILLVGFESEGTNSKEGFKLAMKLRDRLMADRKQRVSSVIGEFEFIDAASSFSGAGLTFQRRVSADGSKD